MVRIRIPGEHMWATPLGGNHYRLENEPLHPDYSFGDMVEARKIDGVLTVERARLPEDLLKSDPEYAKKVMKVWRKSK